ncbi:hypothetical protein BKA70DRAFT_1334715 [Coprinopsis sp. MPI-PUGE-AT-0042]|nr:hypothetical protein BKA70DRAFT_1334715 [Coprinopsis sp. MPI-PUGE-AT-0042]
MSGSAAIPTEILLEIFQQSLPQRLDQEGRLSFQIIRSVCSRWRAIALSSPVLWSSVTITYNNGDEGLDDGYLNIFIVLDAWFSRAGKCVPLELEYLDPMVNSMSSEEVAAMNSLLQRYQARWRFLSLFIEPICFCDAFFDLPPSSWTNLHTLTLCTYDFVPLVISEERAAQGYDALEKIPSLRTILVEDHDDYEFTRRFGPLDLAELHINFDIFRVDHARLITAYSSLTKLTLVAASGLATSLSLDQDITLPSLLFLSCNTHHLSVLDPFTTPALAELDIQLSDDPYLYEDVKISAFLGRCTSTLQTFTLNSYGNGAFVARVLPALSVLSSLSRLTLDKWPKDLQETEDQDWFRSLRELTVLTPSSDVFESERMVNLASFLRRREELGLVPLENLTIHRSSVAVAFPYALFDDLGIGKLRVMVPL